MFKGRSSIEKEAEWHGSSESIPYTPGKGIFLGLLTFTSLLVFVILFFFWYIPSVGLGNIHPALPYILGSILALMLVLILTGVIVLSAAILKGKDILQSYLMRGPLIRFFLPLMIMLGGFLKIPRIKIEQSFIEVNNQLVRSMAKGIHPERILLLLPHCIQFIDCKIKVTQNVRNCVGCKRCEIAELIGLSDEFGIDLFVSTGGTIARRMVYEKRPDAIVAVACERDLTSGIQDAYPLPVLAVVNKRPQGYCIGTGVDVPSVKEALHALLV